MDDEQRKPGKRHPMSRKNRIRLHIDLCNLLLGIVVIVLSIITMSTETISVKTMYPVLFFLGAAMMALNSIRYIRRKNLLSLLFIVIAAVLAVVGIYAM